MKALRAATMFAMLIPALASAQGALTPDAAFRTHAAAYAAAMNKHDAAALAALYTPDADVVVNDGPRVIGRAAITADAQKMFDTWPAARKFSLMVVTSRMLTPDIAIVETAATFSEGPVKTDRGTWVAVRKDGKWLIAALRVFPAVATK